MKVDSCFISVIVPVYNGERFLLEAVESIQRQNYHPLEIVIVDDGSTDGTAKIATSFDSNVCYVYQQNSGPPAARNKGLRMARGNCIAFLDADDLWSENKLELQLERLAADQSVEIVLGHTQNMQQTGAVDGKPLFEAFLNPYFALFLGCALFRKTVFNKVGLFDETQRHCDDIDWFLRAKELGVSMVILQEVMQFYRRHKHNITNQKKLEEHYFITALKKSIVRRRQQGDGLVVPISSWGNN